MRNDYEEIAAELYECFPSTPRRFQQIVSQEVSAHRNAGRNAARKRKRSLYKALLPIAACLILVGSTVAAARLPVFSNWLSGLGINAERAEQSIVHSGDNSGVIIMESVAAPEGPDSSAQEDALFQVTDVYYDGSTLMFWAQPAGEYFELGDHVYINGFDSRLEYVAETEEGSGVYECKVTVMSEELQKTDTDVISVKVNVYTAPDKKSEFSFTVESDKFETARQNTGSVSGLSFGKIVSYDVITAPSAINLRLNWEVYDEDMVRMLQWGEYILEDASGKRLTHSEWLRSNGTSVPEYDADRACTTFTQELEIAGFDAASPTMKLIPVRVQWDADGSMIPGSEEVLEENAITIDLKK